MFSLSSGCKLIGAQSLDFWPKVASAKFAEDHNIDLSVGWEGYTSAATDADVKPSTLDISLAPGIIDDTSISTKTLSRNKDRAVTEGASIKSNIVDEITVKGSASLQDEMEVCITAHSSVNKPSHKYCSRFKSAPDSSCPNASDHNHNSSDSVNASVTPATTALVDTKASVSSTRLVNGDIVCEHGSLNPQSYVSWLPKDSYDRILKLCEGRVHAAALREDFDLCTQCQVCYGVNCNGHSVFLSAIKMTLLLFSLLIL